MSSLVDMARSAVKEDATPLMPQESKYPYGLNISLEDESLDKVNMDIANLEIGDVFPLDVLVKVVSKSINENEGGGSRRCVTLQITHMGAEEEPEQDSLPSLENHGYLRYSGG